MKDLRPTIFIVDDEPLLIEMLSDYLKGRNSDINIKSFLTGEECLEHVSERPDVIILDYYLNSKEKNAANGIDILRGIKSQDKSIPVIMLSSQGKYGTAAKTIMYGAVHYVPKGQDAFEDIYELIKANT